jgi:RNA polymerase sigma-70 factor (ECF subfamily)
MPDRDATSAENPAFPPTQWSLVGRVSQTTSGPQRQALEQLLSRYLPALRAHLVLERRIAPEQADDLLQGFVSNKILEHRLIARSDRDRGKFRTFLLRALNNFVIDEFRRGKLERKLLLPSGQAGESDGEDPQLNVVDQSSEDDVSSDAFDREWAQRVIGQAVERMRAECQLAGRSDIWGVFNARILGPAMRDEEPASYEQLIKDYKLASPAQASNVLMTAKRSFTRHLKTVVAEYAQGKDMDEELLDLKRILSA